MSADAAIVRGLWRGLACEFAREAGHDPTALLGIDFSGMQPHDPLILAAGRMRNRASYVAIAGFGIPQITLARATGLKKSGISKGLQAIEDRRDCAEEDAALTRVAAIFGVSL